jgi:outer membrane protein
MNSMLTLILIGAFLNSAHAQNSPSAESLPSAPQPQADNAASPIAPQVQLSLTASLRTAAASQSEPATQAPDGPMRLTRSQAEQLAIKNNPRISVGRLLALAQHQVYRETRSAELPNFNGSITAVDANEGSRIGAGSLTASRLFEHAGG